MADEHVGCGRTVLDQRYGAGDHATRRRGDARHGDFELGVRAVVRESGQRACAHGAHAGERGRTSIAANSVTGDDAE
jgi:hypothetical protein